MNFLTALLPIFAQLFGKAFGIDMNSPETKVKLAEIAVEAEMAAQAIPLAQIGVNAAEARSRDPFVSRWRPFIGWVCGAAFAYHFVVAPVIVFMAEILGHQLPMPHFDIEALIGVLTGLLGLGSMRTFEKVKGVS